MKNFFLILTAATTANISHALPIDWHGEFQVDTNRIEKYSRTASTDADTSGTDGSQQVQLAGGQKAGASFQTYIFKLQPKIIINDSTTITAELTSGYGKGGRFGDSSTKKQVGTNNSTFTNALYSYNTSSDNQLNLTQAYATFYADTATYKIGRHTAHWGLGAIQNSGDNLGDRHSSTRDGITVEFKIGNFNISPYYSKISSKNSLTKAARVKESGLSLMYDNKDQDMAFGILYAKNKAGNFSDLSADLDGTANTTLGLTEVKITDIYFRKSLGDFSFEAEVPLLTGELGNLYSASAKSKYKAKAFLFHATYKVNNNHVLKFNAGSVSGDSGDDSSFDAMYLNPNYQVANLLFRYNLAAVADTTQNIYDSYVNNATFLKISHLYDAGSWSWENSVIWAKASEVAKAGQQSFDHTKNKTFQADFDQKDDLGIEIDSNFQYLWNSSVTIGGNIGYLLTGDYYAYTNTETESTVKDSYVLKAFANIKF